MLHFSIEFAALYFFHFLFNFSFFIFARYDFFADIFKVFILLLEGVEHLELELKKTSQI